MNIKSSAAKRPIARFIRIFRQILIYKKRRPAFHGKAIALKYAKHFKAAPQALNVSNRRGIPQRGTGGDGQNIRLNHARG
jgi:hypothetical protein